VSEPATHQRREIHYSGWVQGVGFRYTAARIARQHNVAGYVRNLRDGRVQLVAEGTAKQLDGCLAEIAEAMENYIESVDIRTAEATGEFAGFDIRF
jgi:acylphosphatase